MAKHLSVVEEMRWHQMCGFLPELGAELEVHRGRDAMVALEARLRDHGEQLQLVYEEADSEQFQVAVSSQLRRLQTVHSALCAVLQSEPPDVVERRRVVPSLEVDHMSTRALADAAEAVIRLQQWGFTLEAKLAETLFDRLSKDFASSSPHRETCADYSV